MGLPKVLEDMVSVLSDNNTLHSWSIFQEKNGFVNIKLKFSQEIPVNHDQPTAISYKKKTSKQVQRDYERSKAWKASKGSYITSCANEHPLQTATTQSDSSGVQTSAMSKAQSEFARTTEPDLALNPDADIFLMPTPTLPTSPVHQEDSIFSLETLSPCEPPLQSATQQSDSSGVKTRAMRKAEPELACAKEPDLASYPDVDHLK